MKVGSAGCAVAIERANWRGENGWRDKAVAVIRNRLRGVYQIGSGIGEFDGPHYHGRFAPVKLIKGAKGYVRPVLGVAEK